MSEMPESTQTRGSIDHGVSVEMLNVGWLTAPAGILRVGDEDPERPIRFPVPAYLIETASERILLDTGLHPAAARDPAAYYARGEPFAIFTLEQEQSVADQIEVASLTKVVLTHLHYDHAGGLALIPTSVPVVLQRSEWQAGHDRAAVERNFFFPLDYTDDDRQVVLVDGDHDLLGDGSVELLHTPGHTPGHQSVRVGNLVLGADVAYFATGLDDHKFPVYGDDHEEQGRSAERLRGLRDAGLSVVPGHDPDVLRPGPVTA